MTKILKKYRTYFDKNNTIVLNSLVNTANNPVSELMCGETCSRFLFQTDFTELKARVASHDIDITKTEHKLFIKNTSNFDVTKTLTDNSLTFDGKLRAYSIDVELYAIEEYWDAGVGYDFINSPLNKPDERSFVKGASNWHYRTNNALWGTSGGISSGATPLFTQHLDVGSEDIEMDVTEAVNDIINNAATNYGFLLKFSNDFEITTNPTSYIGLFTKNTQTFFEPYIETTQNISIHDDRRNFYNNKVNNLYLYTNIGTELNDLDTTPTVTIVDANDDTFTFNSERISKGIYCVPVSGCTFTDYVQYTDTWDNLYYNGQELQPIELDFVVKPASDFFKIGVTKIDNNIYGLSLSGIKVDEKIKSSDVRTISVNIREPYTPHFINTEHKVYYTLYLKQGPNRVTIIDWTEVDLFYHGFEFTLDTTWLVPQQYFIDIKVANNKEVNIFTQEAKFNVVSEVTNKPRI